VELGRHLPDDEDTLGFQLFQMCQAVAGHNGSGALSVSRGTETSCEYRESCTSAQPQPPGTADVYFWYAVGGIIAAIAIIGIVIIVLMLRKK
jgi:nitrous oxide reductase